MERPGGQSGQKALGCGVQRGEGATRVQGWPSAVLAQRVLEGGERIQSLMGPQSPWAWCPGVTGSHRRLLSCSVV